jgi:hypothetical protein
LASQVSGLVQSVSAESPQAVPTVAWFAPQLPDPSHVSGSVQSVSDESPHDVPALASFV